MVKLQAMSQAFHEKFDVLINKYPTIPDIDTCLMRHSLIREETQELLNAFINEDIIAVADALGDLLTVIYGTATSCGLNMDPICDEIYCSNMSKSGKKRDDGKVMKDENYKPPDLKPIIQRMIDEKA